MLKSGGVGEVLNNKKVYAGIVTFNPSLKVLEDNVLSV